MNAIPTPASTVLVTAATGTVGRHLVPLLEQRGATVRAFDRTADPEPQLAGVDAVFLACPNVEAQVAYEVAVIDAAARAGVARLVKLSARGAALDSPVAFWDWHARIEQHLASSGLPAVVLRPGFSMANLLAQVDPVRTAGVLPVPAADARVAMIDPADVAVVASVALTDPELPTGAYELTGPAAIDFAEVARSWAAAAGRPVTYVDVPPDRAVPAMVAAGLPAFVADQIATVFAALRSGAQAEVSDDVRRLTGRSPRSIVDFLADALAGRDVMAGAGRD
ncbi:MAG TPA: NmrA family NAD(P)-binding protein [Microlunatus sp.]